MFGCFRPILRSLTIPITAIIVGAGGLISCLALPSCALPARDSRLTLQVNVESDANLHTPVPVDLVFVWDKTLAGQIKGLKAKDWFQQKAQFIGNDPKGKALTVCQWEWVPGQKVPDINVMVPAAARSWVRGTFVFAKYREEEPEETYRFQVAPGKTTVLRLGDTTIANPTPRPLGTSTGQPFVVVRSAKPPYVVLGSAAPSSVIACNQP